MSEFTQQPPVLTTAAMPRWASLSVIRGMLAAAVLVSIVAIAASGLLGTSAIEAPRSGVEAGQPGSRLDDYGLRHPFAASGAVEPGSRLDDYGLRHPFAASGAVEPGSRLDDYGLRHPFGD